MDVIYALIPSMIVIGIILVGILIWAVKRGQYEDMEGDGNRILMDDDDPGLPGNQQKKDARSWPDAEDD
ncbi:MAG: cbb3-type cytochrome oxidase assembly protein CcoS [Gammaproteobacteria bacterium]|nr:cbb3-type cytochrome oxidase assembly protein CcoS [Gammaproteobacteria bacterium]